MAKYSHMLRVKITDKDWRETKYLSDNGRETSIKDLGSVHLDNIIRKLKREISSREKALELLKKEQEIRIADSWDIDGEFNL